MSIATEIQRLQTAKADIKSAIENKGVTVGDGTIDTYAAKIDEISGGDYDQGYEDGKNSVVPFERYATQIALTSLNIFGTSEVVLNLDSAENLIGLCTIQGQGNPNVNTTVEHLTINCPNLVNSLNMMMHCDNYNVDTVLKRVTLNVDVSKSARWTGAFNNLRALETIDGYPLNFESCIDTTINCFGSCESLIDFRVVAGSIKQSFKIANSPNLSPDTIQSFIDGLADLTGGTAQTLTLHATVGAKLTDEQKATITAKNWTLVY